MIIQEEHNIDFFKNQMPNKPYCTNNLDMGLSLRNKGKSLRNAVFTGKSASNPNLLTL